MKCETHGGRKDKSSSQNEHPSLESAVLDTGAGPLVGAGRGPESACLTSPLMTEKAALPLDSPAPSRQGGAALESARILSTTDCLSPKLGQHHFRVGLWGTR